MKAKSLKQGYNVSAYCPQCEAITVFQKKSDFCANRKVHDDMAQYSPSQQSYKDVRYVMGQCSSCGRGGFATFNDRGDATNASLVDFYPASAELASLPAKVPSDIQEEFREAEGCAAYGLNRAASALFRSVLEKTLKANGYTKSNDSSLTDLQKRIDAAANDGVITQARQTKAHEEIRSLGNDVLHEEWRKIPDEDVESAHHYTQRILEDFYDDRVTVEANLKTKGRLS